MKVESIPTLQKQLPNWFYAQIIEPVEPLRSVLTTRESQRKVFSFGKLGKVRQGDLQISRQEAQNGHPMHW